MKLEADSRLGGQKDEARLLGKVSLDTWRFILGYIAKYHWILFQGSFLCPRTRKHFLDVSSCNREEGEGGA